VLHPRHKLQYFKDAKWEKEWIKEAKNIVREVFDQSYASLDADLAAPSAIVRFHFILLT
jgi:hypothetical protein